MAVNVIIGVGGTGAKIVESVLMLMSTGIGPKGKVIVGLVDQDNSNGNVVRSEHLLSLIGRVRRDFDVSFNPDNAIDWKADEAAGGIPLFSIQLEPLFGEGAAAHWRPAPDNMPTLRDILRHQDLPPDERALFDVLFRGDSAAVGEQEQTMDLAEGYRGRAHVGTAALVSAVNHDQPEFLRKLIELMKASNGGEEVRIFMAGSLFGGTGAAGFPTIARMLHKLRDVESPKEQIKGDKVRLGGVLMLPYFRFGEPADASANVITSAQLLPQARVALEFYQSLIHQEAVFDHLYITGWDEMFDLGYHEPGRGEQRNPPLLPELVAALAAVDFFDPEQNIVPTQQPIVAARRDQQAFDWDDLPASPRIKQLLDTRFGGALRFAVWWYYRVEPALDVRGLFGGITQGWLKKLAGDTDWQRGTPEARKNLQEYCSLLLDWASAMQLLSNARLGRFGLWDTAPFRTADPKKPTKPIELRSERSEEESRDDLTKVLRPRDLQKPPVDAQVVFSDLHSDLKVGESQGLGRLVAGVHHATQPFRNGG